MTRPIAVLRPEPGNAATMLRVEAVGLRAISLPLFAVRPCDWTIPDPSEFDALLLTSANTVRLAGAGLTALAALPVLAVGAATAQAARAAGLTIRVTGSAGACALMADAANFSRVLHLAGRDQLEEPPMVVRVITVYASDTTCPDAKALRTLAGSVALLHSPRAARRFAELVDMANLDRLSIRLATLSDVIARAAGAGWDRISVAAQPNDAALLDEARRLAG